MPHLIKPLRNQTIPEVVERLRECHHFLVSRVVASATSAAGSATWGIAMKRMSVTFEVDGRPPHIGKDDERFSELVNMLATIERLIGTPSQLESSGAFPEAVVRECHPTTSHEDDANDVVLTDQNGDVVARAEICDVVNPRDSNKKGRHCIKALGCGGEIPSDGVRRFIGTSPELAARLTSPRGRYRYPRHEAGDGSGTVILELVS